MATSRKKTFDSINPVSGEVLATFPVDGKETVSLVVETAHEALYQWQHLGFKGRKKVLLDWSKYLINHVDEIAEFLMPHPSLSELFGETVLSMTGRSINA